MADARAETIALFDGPIIAQGHRRQLRKTESGLSLMRNPVIFVTEVVAALTTFIGGEALVNHTPAAFPDHHCRSGSG